MARRHLKRNVTHQILGAMPTPKQHEDAAARQRAYRERQAAAREAELKAKGLPVAPPISTMPSKARWTALEAQAKATLQTLRDEMENYHSERSESWQESERGEAFGDRIQALDEILSALDELPEL